MLKLLKIYKNFLYLFFKSINRPYSTHLKGTHIVTKYKNKEYFRIIPYDEI
jgi:hypothetical protein